MNDATEFESSLTGMIEFFQNLRRKMGALEAETGAQHELLRTVATWVTTLQQDRHTDQRTFATLASDFAAQAGRLNQLQIDARLLAEQLTQFEALVACLQEDRHQAQETLAALAGDLQTQGAALRQELDSAFEHRIPSPARVVALEEQLADQNQQLHDLQSALKTQSQDAGQTRQDLRQQQDRQKHLETLIGKVTADTSSTRQILNVLQADLTTQSDALRELDQTWRDSLALYQDRLDHLQMALADSDLHALPLADRPHPPATAPEPLLSAALVDVAAADSPPAMSLIEQERLAELAATVAATREQQQALEEQLATVQTALARQDEHLAELQNRLIEQLQTQQQRLGELETALDTAQRSTSSPEETVLPAPNATLADLTEPLDALRRTLQQQMATLTATLEAQRLASQEMADRMDDLQQDVQHLRQHQTAPSPAAEQRLHLQTDDPYVQEFRQDLDGLQEAVTTLETRLTSQAQAFSGNFEQFQSLRTDIQDLQQQVATLEPAQQLSVIEQGLTAQEQEMTLLKDAVQQVKADSQQISAALRQNSHDSTLAALETRLNEQQERLTDLSATVEAMRTDARATQEQVLTMAANVAQRLHEFQNQLLEAKTSQGEHLQEVEQKLIMIQATVETWEAQRKPRRWFSMPATLTTLAFTVSAALLAALAQVIWAIG